MYINVKYVKIISRVHFKNGKINRNFPFWVGERGAEVYRVETNFSVYLALLGIFMQKIKGVSLKMSSGA